MKKIINVGRIFYAAALIVYGFQQFIYADFRPVFVPAWQSFLPGLPVWAYLFGIGLIAAALAIVLEKKAKEAALILGVVFLALVCLVHIPYEIIADPYSKHLALWTNALKELALAGGAFIVAGTFQEKSTTPAFLKLLEPIIPFGRIFFSITMISFGIQHFMYAENVATLVPAWIPDHLFWTYFAGVTLICSGVAIILNIRMKQIAVLLGTMIFLWFIVLHLPRAFAEGLANRGNEVASSFDALAFTGIAFMIAFGVSVKNDELL
ncbi:hypothetical protein [Runella sp.]|uniref:hypothetical protein n=1 Tax=Runella sp. TaxID=1960881 RepID=UPI003D0AE4FB